MSEWGNKNAKRKKVRLVALDICCWWTGLCCCPPSPGHPRGWLQQPAEQPCQLQGLHSPALCCPRWWLPDRQGTAWWRWEHGWVGRRAWLAGSVVLAASLLQKCQASPKPCCPPRAGKPQKCLYSVIVAMCMWDLPSCGWSVFFAYGCVVYHAILPERSCWVLFVSSPKSILSSTLCPPEQDWWTKWGEPSNLY